MAYEIFGIVQKKCLLYWDTKWGRIWCQMEYSVEILKKISEGLTTTCNALVTYKGDTSKLNSQVKNNVPVLTSGIILWKSNKELIFG